MGINTIKKENRVAFDLSTPSNIAVAIVDPDLETPGKIAKAWDNPIMKA